MKKHIEEERNKLNNLLAGGAQAEEVYTQSLAVDKLIEEFMELL